MKLLIGLGNPGEKYKNNRHDVGHMFVNFLASQELLLRSQFLKTDCFMNESGKFVKQAVDKFKKGRFFEKESSLDGDLYIVHDDLDLPLGQWKIQLGVGPKVHYGVNSVEESLGTRDFWRIRIGVDNRAHSAEAPRAKGDEYVLQDFTGEERKILEEIFPKILEELRDKLS